MKERLRKYFSGLTKNAVFIALSSLFADISTEMLFPILPVYLTQNLNASGSVVGIIEGIATATQNIIQGVSGYLSDKWRKRKSLALFGYFLSAISKPIIGMVSVWQGVLAVRISDRLGAGTRSAPRDALIASSVEEKDRGKAFGLESIGDNLGAFIGPLLTVLLFFLLQTQIKYIFYIAIVPGLLAVLMIMFVNDRTDRVKINPKVNMQIHKFPKQYWRYILVTALFGIGNSSNSFIILFVKDEGTSLLNTVLIYSVFNLVAALISYPAGALSDKWGRKPVLFFGFIIFFISYLSFAFISDIFLMGVLFVFYGLFQGIYRSVGKSFAADLVSDEWHASGIGWYSATVGLTGLIASIIAGLLWDKVGHSSVFIFGACSSFIGIISLLILIPKEKKHPSEISH